MEFNMKKSSLWSAIYICTIMIISLGGCKSKPPQEDPPPQETVVEVETTPEPKPEPQKSEGDDSLFGKAEAAIIRAEEVDAAFHAPDELESAYKNLDNARNFGDKDDLTERDAILNKSIGDAEEAFAITMGKLAAEWIERLETLARELTDLHGERHMPGYYRFVIDEKNDTVLLLTEKNYTDAIPAYKKAEYDLSATISALKENLDMLTVLQQEAERALGEAEAAEAEIYATEEYLLAHDSFEKGIGIFNNSGNLVETEEHLTRAGFAARYATKKATFLKDVQEVDLEIFDLQEAIDEAVAKIDTQADASAPPDSLAQFLSEEPLIDLSNVIAEEEPKATSAIVEPLLEENKTPEEEGAKEEVAYYYIPKDGSAVVLGDESGATLLEKAREAWKNGVSARNAGELEKARSYMEEARQYLTTFNTEYGVLKTYTVRSLVPSDCLWRIAGYPDIYDDPFQWQRIYQRNRRIIKNPSLIYPGQVLIIPTK